MVKCGNAESPSTQIIWSMYMIRKLKSINTILINQDVRPMKIKMGHKSTQSVCVVSGLDCV